LAAIKGKKWSVAGSPTLQTVLLVTKRRHIRRLALLATSLAVAGAVAWFVVKLHRARVQSHAVAQIRQAGGWVFYDCEYHPSGHLKSCGPRQSPWIPTCLGVDFLGSVHGVKLTDAGHLEGLGDLQAVSRPCPNLTDQQLAHLETLTDLQWLALHDAPISDAGLTHLETLANLERVWLDNSRITDAGLASLSRLTNLRTLSLRGTDVTDEGLRHLASLTGLERLLLTNTQISDAGLPNLDALTQLRQLDLTRTHCTFTGAVQLLVDRQGRDLAEALSVADLATTDQAGSIVSLDLSDIHVCDAGLARLKHLPKLQWLYLNGSAVNNAGMCHLEGLTSLTLLDLSDTQLTDAGLKHLARLPALRILHLSGTQVTQTGVREAQTAGAPHLRVYHQLSRP